MGLDELLRRSTLMSASHRAAIMTMIVRTQSGHGMGYSKSRLMSGAAALEAAQQSFRLADIDAE